MAEFSVENRISEEPAFSWWVKYVLKKRDHIIYKAQRFWVKTNNYSIRLPKTLKEAVDIDKENSDTLWWDDIMKEMKMYDLRSKSGRNARKIYQSDTKKSSVA